MIILLAAYVNRDSTPDHEELATAGFIRRIQPKIVGCRSPFQCDCMN